MNENLTTSQGKALEVALRNLNRIHSDIQFADRKASLLLIPSTGLLALLWHSITKDTPILPLVITCIAIVSLLVPIVFAFLVILPRGRSHNRMRPKGVLDSARVSHYPYHDFDQYRLELNTKTELDLIKELQELTFDYSHIQRKKYLFVEYTVCAMIPSSVLALISLLLLKIALVP